MKRNLYRVFPLAAKRIAETRKPITGSRAAAIKTAEKCSGRGWHRAIAPPIQANPPSTASLTPASHAGAEGGSSPRSTPGRTAAQAAVRVRHDIRLRTAG